MRCLFTNKATNSKEHVIPDWLQRRFNLSEQTLRIPNGTLLQYKHHCVPADSNANQRFGEIERRISQGILDPAEVYLWALKIHIGCIYRDGSILTNRRDPTSPTVIDVSKFSDEVWIFQQLFDIWSNGGSTNPSPFGSVFILDSLHPSPCFDFMHCLMTGTVGIDIGGKFILVFLWDQGDATHSSILESWENYHVPNVISFSESKDFQSYCYAAHRTWACESAYNIYRIRRSISMFKTPTELVLLPSLTPPSPKPHSEAELNYICSSFGLKLVEYKGEVSNIYRLS